MTLYQAVAGDNRSALPAQLDGVSNLTGAAVVAHLVNTAPAGGSYTLTVTVTDATERTVLLRILSSDNIPAGDYLLEWQATFGDGSVLTWPTGGYDRVQIRPQLA